MSINITRAVVDSLDGGAWSGLPRREERFYFDMDRRSAQALCDVLKRLEMMGHDSGVPVSLLWLTQVTRDLKRFLDSPPSASWEEKR